jgi:hypothetical protein
VEPHETHTPAHLPDQPLPARVPRRKVGPAPPANSRPTSKPSSRDGSWRGNRSWDKLLILVGVAAVVAAVLVVPGIVQPGGKNPVAAAAEATADAPGVRMNFTMSTQGSVAMSMHGTGVMNGDTNRAEFEFSGSGGPAGGGGLAFKEVVDNLDVYMNMPQLAGQLGTTKSWVLVRADAVLGMLGGNSSGLAAGMSASPTQQLDALESASDSVTELGRERVGGVDTTHYSAVIDMQKVLDQLGDSGSKLGDLLDQSGLAQMSQTVDVWIDGQGLIRRETSNMTMGSLGAITMAIDFSDYGIHPNIDVPPESDVYDMTPMLQQALGS